MKHEYLAKNYIDMAFDDIVGGLLNELQDSDAGTPSYDEAYSLLSSPKKIIDNVYYYAVKEAPQEMKFAGKEFAFKCIRQKALSEDYDELRELPVYEDSIEKTKELFVEAEKNVKGY